MPTITMTSEHTGRWTKMRRSLGSFSGPEPLRHIQSLGDFITTTSGFRFSVHTAQQISQGGGGLLGLRVAGRTFQQG